MAVRIKKKHVAPTLKEDFQRMSLKLEALRQEIFFILNNSLIDSAIKVHQIESRVKDFESISKNVQNKKYDTLEQINDLVGARIICLFKSDLAALQSMIGELFSVVSVDNKIDSTDDIFGYMSIHIICQMKPEYVGPRYEKIGEQNFEIQIRTLCMHAWAAISHYLDYKAEWDIPYHLRKSLNALSGLFYVADDQYEQIFNSREQSEKIIGDNTSDEAKNQQINFDTVRAMLRRIFPDRSAAGSEVLSLFVRELTKNNYATVGDVENDILRGYDNVPAREEEVKKNQNVRRGGPFYADLGAARVALKSVNPDYEQISMIGGKTI